MNDAVCHPHLVRSRLSSGGSHQTLTLSDIAKGWRLVSESRLGVFTAWSTRTIVRGNG